MRVINTISLHVVSHKFVAVNLRNPSVHAQVLASIFEALDFLFTDHVAVVASGMIQFCVMQEYLSAYGGSALNEWKQRIREHNMAAAR